MGFIQFDIIMTVLVTSVRFIWIPRYGSKAFRNIFTLTVRGSTLVVKIWRVQTSDSDD